MSELARIRDQLADLVAPYIPPPAQPLDITPWIGMSLLQKSIRRGREDLALRAGASLSRDAPDKLWRRLGVVAVEDVGVADIETARIVVAALAGKSFRDQLGGDWKVASYLVSRMVRAPKCRAADDVLTVIMRHTILDHTRAAFAGLPTPDLIAVATGDAPLFERALAVTLVAKRGVAAVDTMMAAMGEVGVEDCLLSLARQNYRRTREPLGPLVALLSLEPSWQSAPAVADDIPPEVLIGPLPCWSIDAFTRPGRAAMSRFLATDAKAVCWIDTHVAQAHRLEVLGNLLFFAEGGLLRQRLQWLIGVELRRWAEEACLGASAAEGIALMQGDLCLLDDIRRHEFEGSHHPE